MYMSRSGMKSAGGRAGAVEPDPEPEPEPEPDAIGWSVSPLMRAGGDCVGGGEEARSNVNGFKGDSSRRRIGILPVRYELLPGETDTQRGR